jgi:hypothetical protein
LNIEIIHVAVYGTIIYGIFNLSLLLSTNAKYYLIVMSDWRTELKKLIKTQVYVRNRTSKYICSYCETVKEILHYVQIPKLTGFVDDRQNGTGQANRVCSDCITRISDY